MNNEFAVVTYCVIGLIELVQEIQDTLSRLLCITHVSTVKGPTKQF